MPKQATMSDSVQKRTKENELPICKYGAKCYRKNAEHWKEFSHESKENNDAEVSQPKKARSALPNKENKNGSGQSSSKRIQIDDVLKKRVKHLTGFNMPCDFYEVWQLANDIHNANPLTAFEAAGVTLVGAFDILAGRLDAITNEYGACLHYRYRQDLIECQTVLLCEPLSLHVAYWRDEDSAAPQFLCTIDHSKEFFPKMVQCGDNLFSALMHVTTRMLNEAKTSNKNAIESLQAKITATAKAHSYVLIDVTDEMKKRQKKAVVATTLHGLGIVVPFKDGIGYRPLSETNALKKLLNALVESDEAAVRQGKMNTIQEMITYVQFANDEADYGMGLELGHDLLYCGCEQLDKPAYQLLTVAYGLLHRPIFEEIARYFIKGRHKDDWKLSLA